MKRMKGMQASFFMLAAVAALLSQNLVIPVVSTARFEDQKNYYSPDPHTGGSPPAGSNPSPVPGSGGSHGSTPSHGTPSHGGSHNGGTPAGNCGNPPSGGHYSPTPHPPRGGGGSGYHPTPPSTPHIPCSCPPSTPSRPSKPSPAPPSGGGGAGYNPTPPRTPRTPATPSTPTTPSTPSIPTIPTPDPGSGGGGYYNTPPNAPATPSTPTIVSPPATPSIPGISIPSPPFDPNSPFTGTCNFWSSHPGFIWGLFGWWGTLGSAFGVTSVPGFGAHMSLLQALSNTRTDGLGALYREGTASLLNSMVNNKFPYTTGQVRDSFVAALTSNKAAAAQAKRFKLANEGRVPPRT